MKNSCPAVRKHAVTVRGWSLIFLIALALHLILLFLFRPLRSGVAESRSNDRYTVFLTEKELAGMRSDPYDLRYWLRYMDPEQVLKADREAGFSMHNRRPNVSAADPVRFSHSMFRFSPEAGFRLFSSVPARTLADFVSGPEVPVLYSVPVRKTRAETAQYPVWTDEAGTVFSGLFYPDRDSLEQLKSLHASKPTFLRLHVQPGAVPFVKILRSCGNVQLDLLAARQLKIRKENFEGGSGVKIKYYMVSWQPPDHGNILERVKP